MRLAARRWRLAAVQTCMDHMAVAVPHYSSISRAVGMLIQVCSLNSSTVPLSSNIFVMGKSGLINVLGRNWTEMKLLKHP